MKGTTRTKLMICISAALLVSGLTFDQDAFAKGSKRKTAGARTAGKAGRVNRHVAGKRGKYGRATARVTKSAEPPPPNLVSEAQSRLADGKTDEAVDLLQKTLAGYPKDVKAHMLLGETLFNRKDFTNARPHLISVMRLAKGSSHACKANGLLFSMPPDVIAPHVGPETVAISRSLGGWFAERGIQTGKGLKPTVIDFWASWSQPCKQLKPAMEKAKSELSDKIEFLSINVDDPENEYMIEKYGISPIPTVVFLNAEGQVMSYCLDGENEKLTEELRKVLAR